ncbi:Ankyrin repeat-containing protein [Acorus calamus]|uniref:Ankyrin repeat-containing protein n=1 Tax=Acorus calamus TaxID=4465 RepID=A0AAV9C8Z7_ACOCL|nr:Ankyrin repeat-containing protein [Acorus calamus]
MMKQLMAKHDDTPLHLAARARNLTVVSQILERASEGELREILVKQNQAGETPLFIAAEYGYVDVLVELLKYYDVSSASVKAKNGYDALLVAAKQGDIEVLKELMKAFPELSMTADPRNTTALHIAAMQGHTEVANLLLEARENLANIPKNNGKTALHFAARNGHLEVVKALLSKKASLVTRTDKKGQTALHMAVKGQNLELVVEMIKCEPLLINLVDKRGNTALHIATRKGRAQIVKKLLDLNETNTRAINRSGETALDTAEKIGNPKITRILTAHGVLSAQSIQPARAAAARKLARTASDIKHDVHTRLAHARSTRKRVRADKLHAEGLNNAINSTTVVAVLISTVAFSAIFAFPGHNSENPGTPFLIFFVFDSVALFISLAVVVVQTSVVVVERAAKERVMAVMNKLMWVACVLVTVAFLAMSFVVAGEDERALAVAVTVMGTMIMAATLGTMCYWVLKHRVEVSRRLSGLGGSSIRLSRSFSMSGLSDTEMWNGKYKNMYAI